MVLQSKVMGSVLLLGKTRAAHRLHISMYYGKRTDFLSAEFSRSVLHDCGVK